MKKVLFAVAAGVATVAMAGFDLQVKLWRGESLSVIVPDECPEISGSAPGVFVDKGTLLPVRYNVEPKSLEYKFVADRAVYGSRQPGIHFATISAAADAKPGVYSFGQLSVTVLDTTARWSRSGGSSPPPGRRRSLSRSSTSRGTTSATTRTAR